MTPLIELSDARHQLRIAPALGGGIVDAFALNDGEPLPLLRPWAGEEAGVLGLGSNVLTPFSNRISGGGFAFEGEFHKVEPNLAGEPYPIHGDGFQAAWEVVTHTDLTADLTHEGHIGPFHYVADLRYALLSDGIETLLQVTNLGPRLPYGGGFHPWFPRFPDTRLHFVAAGVWTEKLNHLPDRHLPLSHMPDWDFRQPRTLPENWINATFTGWHSDARIEQPQLGIALNLSASANLDCAVVYSPYGGADFFCFEPVSHAVDAHSQAGQPGLEALNPGDSLKMSMTLSWSPLELH